MNEHNYCMYEEGRFTILLDSETGKEIGFNSMEMLVEHCKEKGLTQIPFLVEAPVLAKPLSKATVSAALAQAFNLTPVEGHLDIKPEEKPQSFEEAMERYLKAYAIADKAYMQKLYSTERHHRAPVTSVSIAKGGRKYAKIIRNNGVQSSVVCFVEKANGKIWKAASFSKPALNFPRGNVYDLEGSLKTYDTFGLGAPYADAALKEVDGAA